MKLVKTKLYVINFEDEEEANRYLKLNKDSELISDEETSKVFGDYGNYAGPNCTSINKDGSIEFDLDTCIDQEIEEFNKDKRRGQISKAKAETIDIRSMSVAEANDWIDSSLGKGDVAGVLKTLALQVLR